MHATPSSRHFRYLSPFGPARTGLFALALAFAACSSEGPEGPSADGGTELDPDAEDGLGEPTLGDPASGTGGGEGDDGGDPVCESASSAAELVPVYLAFAFDVSGSMGKIEDSECFDREFKWEPVVTATTSFFSSDASSGLLASMALFPAQEDRCSASSYESPEVEMRALPSTEFQTVLSDYEAEVADDGWRGGTPTLHAFQGTVTALEPYLEEDPLAQHAVVLVTDGKPQDCDDVTIEDITSEVAAALEAGISTYVIGVKQPTSKSGCDASAENDELVDNMNAIALAGGTEAPFMIDTGDVAATETSFAAAIQDIRARSVSCEIAIPEHPSGGAFDKDKTDVSVTQDDAVTALPYDPACAASDGWHYDDEQEPAFIELCPGACDSVQHSADAELNVDFLCVDRPDVVK